MSRYLFVVLLTQLFLSLNAVQAAEPALSPALRAPAIYTGDIPTRYADSARAYQGIPSVTQSVDGALWACWYGGPAENVETYVMLARSEDRGKTWSEPLLVVDWPGPVRVYDPNIWSDPDGKLWLFWNQSEDSNNDGRLGVWTISTDEPERGAKARWSEPRRLCNGVMLNKPTVDSKGRWLYPVSHKPNGKKYAIDPSLLGAACYVSTDHGETLYCLGVAEVPENLRGCDEHMFLELSDGALRAYTRVAVGVGVTESRDGGRTWSRVQVSENIKSPSSRFFIRKLASGNWLLVKNGPLDHQTGRERMTAYLSRDEGQTWLGGLVLDEREDVSYPDGQQLDDASIVVTYDRGRTTDREICVARFREEDVVAKRLGPDGALKLVVNKASDAPNAL